MSIALYVFVYAYHGVDLNALSTGNLIVYICGPPCLAKRQPQQVFVGPRHS